MEKIKSLKTKMHRDMIKFQLKTLNGVLPSLVPPTHFQ
jgi:hypothetical protein